LSPHTEDDGFHEIQLNGKQLVFAFMAVTVVSVVIFLSGVQVGRVVQRDRAQVQNADAPAEFKELALDPARAVIPPTMHPGSDPTLAPPPAPPEGEQMKSTTGAAPASATTSAAKDAKAKIDSKPEDKKPGLDSGRAATSDARAPSGSAAAARTESPREGSVPTDPAGKDARPAADQSQDDWVVQVAAVKKRGEADTIAKRLGSKGYSTFVLAEGTNVFRVRVGGYKTKREADVVAAKLKKEERINPWVTQRRSP
jgi:cell division septation protein DedD